MWHDATPLAGPTPSDAGAGVGAGAAREAAARSTDCMCACSAASDGSELLWPPATKPKNEKKNSVKLGKRQSHPFQCRSNTVEPSLLLA